MTIERVLLIAAGGLARETLNAIRTSDTHEVTGFLDDNEAIHGTSIDGVPVLGPIDRAAMHPEAKFVLCAGSGTARRNIANRLAGTGIGPDRYATIVHPNSGVPPDCTVGVGSILLAQVVLTTAVAIGDHVVAMPNVTLTHDDVVDDFATLCAGVTLGGELHIGAAAYLGMNSSVRQRIYVGRESVLGMGAVLLQDLPPGETWTGVPARPLTQEVKGPIRKDEASA